MNEEKINIAVNILNNQIAKLTKELAFSQEFDNELQAKIDVLEKIKAQINLGSMTFAEKVIEKYEKGAITKELERNGQVFYLFNNVEQIMRKAEQIKALVPEANVTYAHGRMTGNQIEEIMQEFVNGESNILVCTTILETGIDIPNANTIIVENADRMGLAQLYQIRGRVGRSNRQAYAYITYKRDKLLSEVADKRLKAIKEFTEFGSGFKIAMRDLEIRGAGSMLRRNSVGTFGASRI